MTYSHHGVDDILGLVNVIDFSQDQLPDMKPRGLWISDDSDYGWEQYLRDSEWGLERLNYKYSVKLKPDANIIYLRTPEDIDDFTAKYRADDEVNRAIAHIGNMPDTIHINWPAVAAEYQGIIITPYQYSRRLQWGTTWYYPWDCASGCIWDKSAIASVRKITRKAKVKN